VIPLGGDNITKDLSIGLRTSTEEAEDIKKNYGHAFYDDAQEDETFDVSIIGSNTKQTYNQLQISDMIEARLEEIYAFAEREITKNYGHALYDDDQEDETFDVSIIGSNTKQTYNQLQISDMIEARLEEIYAFAEREIRKMGYHELPGGYVLTGGTMKMPGVLEL